MFRAAIGNVGQFAIIISFVAAIVAAYAFYKAQSVPENEKKGWLRYAQAVFYIHGLAAVSYTHLTLPTTSRV